MRESLRRGACACADGPVCCLLVVQDGFGDDVGGRSPDGKRRASRELELESKVAKMGTQMDAMQGSIRSLAEQLESNNAATKKLLEAMAK